MQLPWMAMLLLCRSHSSSPDAHPRAVFLQANQEMGFIGDSGTGNDTSGSKAQYALVIDGKALGYALSDRHKAALLQVWPRRTRSGLRWTASDIMLDT